MCIIYVLFWQIKGMLDVTNGYSSSLSIREHLYISFIAL